MGLRQYDYRCDHCDVIDERIVKTEERDYPIVCPHCSEGTMSRIPTSTALGLSREQRDHSLRERSRQDNLKHQNDRVAEALERVDQGKGRHGGLFDPKTQESLSKRKK